MAEDTNHSSFTCNGKALFEALNSDNFELAEILLRRGANPNEILIVEGVAPMHIAAGLGEAFVKLLLFHGGNPNVRSADGITPLHVAASWGDIECLRLLLLSGGNPYIRDRDGASVIDSAKTYQHHGCVALLEYFCLLLNMDEDNISTAPKFTYQFKGPLSHKSEHRFKEQEPKYLNSFYKSKLTSNGDYIGEFQKCLNRLANMEIFSANSNACLNVTSPDHPVISTKRESSPEVSMHVRWAEKLTETLPYIRDRSCDISSSSSDTFITCSGDEKDHGDKFFPDFLKSYEDHNTYTLSDPGSIETQCMNDLPVISEKNNEMTPKCTKMRRIGDNMNCQPENSHCFRKDSVSKKHSCGKPQTIEPDLNDSLISSDVSFLYRDNKQKMSNSAGNMRIHEEDFDTSSVFSDFKFEEFDSLLTDDDRKDHVVSKKRVSFAEKVFSTEPNSYSNKILLNQNVDKTVLMDRLLRPSLNSENSTSNDFLNNSFCIPCMPRESLNSTVSDASTVDYIYTDTDNGVQLIERHLPSLQGSAGSGRQSLDSVCTVDSQQTILYDWKAYSNSSSYSDNVIVPSSVDSNILTEIEKLSNLQLRTELLSRGDDPGPITDQTRQVYQLRLKKACSDPNYLKLCKCQPEYSSELSKAFICWDPSGLRELEQQLIASYDKSDRIWREGKLKSSFNYLLLDPRVTLNLPNRIHSLGDAEAFKVFVAAIFYIGKGKRSRPYCHLYEAIKQIENPKPDVCPKVKHILEIWKENMGVVSLHCFQNVIAAEAYTREAAMIDAISINRLTNKKRGDYYGLATTWSQKNKRRLGVYFLKKALTIFQGEGERQILPMDIKVGQ